MTNVSFQLQKLVVVPYVKNYQTVIWWADDRFWAKFQYMPTCKEDCWKSQVFIRALRWNSNKRSRLLKPMNWSKHILSALEDAQRLLQSNKIKKIHSMMIQQLMRWTIAVSSYRFLSVLMVPPGSATLKKNKSFIVFYHSTVVLKCANVMCDMEKPIQAEYFPTEGGLSGVILFNGSNKKAILKISYPKVISGNKIIRDCKSPLTRFKLLFSLVTMLILWKC